MGKTTHYVIVGSNAKARQTSFGALSKASARRLANELTKHGYTVERIVSYAEFWKCTA